MSKLAIIAVAAISFSLFGISPASGDSTQDVANAVTVTAVGVSGSSF